MEVLSLTGIVMAFVVVIVGSILKGSGVAALWSAAAFMVVIVGTSSAIMVQTPSRVLRRALRMARWVIWPPASDSQALIAKVIGWSEIARRQGLLGLESHFEAETDPFAKKGLQLLVDGSEPDVIRGILEVDLAAKEHADTEAAKVFESAGIYSPTLGIIGAVMGLMAVMENLSDPSKLGPGIAGAFVSTVYGIASANLLLLPIASKLKGVIRGQSQQREMVVEGLIAIAEGENPRNIETKLQGFLH
ncbi:MAG: flagellar motor protein [Mizugakiibacter sp.]|uniref:flagellar motor protein n=1 Tax=Mizugakiibacter sp. TaxID=1972610 RepID=UPI0031C4C544|nr:flagellar motor protein [Xanthomonadaceae bacterium]